jgi:hypothetical protein
MAAVTKYSNEVSECSINVALYMNFMSYLCLVYRDNKFLACFSQ